MIHYGNIKEFDTANGEGVRTSIFVSGCRNYCKNCFNPETWDFNYGEKLDEKVINKIVESLKPSYIAGLSILGGEPFEEENQEGVLNLIKEVKNNIEDKNIWIYTGYTMDLDLKKGGKKYTEYTDEILNSINVLVDGKFIEELKDITLKFRGSSNQRVIDMPKTIEDGQINLYIK